MPNPARNIGVPNKMKLREAFEVFCLSTTILLLTRPAAAAAASVASLLTARAARLAAITSWTGALVVNGSVSDRNYVYHFLPPPTSTLILASPRLHETLFAGPRGFFRHTKTKGTGGSCGQFLPVAPKPKSATR
jgi:hypothetical protein